MAHDSLDLLHSTAGDALGKNPLPGCHCSRARRGNSHWQDVSKPRRVAAPSLDCSSLVPAKST